MDKFEQLSKRRKPIVRITIFGLIFSLTGLFTYSFWGSELDGILRKIIVTLIIGVFIISLILYKFPFKKHIVIGYLGFTKEFIEIETLGKKEEYQILDIRKLKFSINGYEGQPYFSTKDIYPEENGTCNFIVVQTNTTMRKVEFFLESKKDLINLTRIINFYSNRIETEVYFKHKRPKS